MRRNDNVSENLAAGGVVEGHSSRWLPKYGG